MWERFLAVPQCSPTASLTLVEFDQQMEAKERVKKLNKNLLLLSFLELDSSVGWRHTGTEAQRDRTALTYEKKELREEGIRTCLLSLYLLPP